MSRVFDALRKSETEAGRRVSSSPDSFFAGLADTQELLEVAIERADVRPESRVVTHSAPHTPGGERFRLLKSHLKELQAAGGLRTLLITSACPQDGKSTVATNLATALSEKGKFKVLLLEGDLRRPSLRSMLGLKFWPGLTECLQSGVDPLSYIRRIEPLAIYLLPAGGETTAPLELLQSVVFTQLMTSLSSHFDWIVVDAPPVLPIADIQTLKKAADATLLVVRAGRTPGEALNETISQLAGHPVLGIVLNCAEKVDDLYGGYYGRGGKKNPA